jgi:toxin YoeB
VLTARFIEDLQHWAATDAKVVSKLLELVDAIRRDPFAGVGKPEPLKGLGPGIWSRRINLEHRLLYRVEGKVVYLLQGRHHY